MGETAAFDAICALAQTLPGALGSHALAVSRALRMIELLKQGEHSFMSWVPGVHLVPPLWPAKGEEGLFHEDMLIYLALPLVAGKGEEDAVVDMQPVIESIAAIREATADGKALPSPAYIMVFPIIRAVLSWPVPSPLHEPALSALALHVSPSICLPRTAMLTLLYQVLETMPAYRYRSGPVPSAILGLVLCPHGEGLSLLKDCPDALIFEREMRSFTAGRRCSPCCRACAEGFQSRRCLPPSRAFWQTQRTRALLRCRLCTCCLAYSEVHLITLSLHRAHHSPYDHIFKVAGNS